MAAYPTTEGTIAIDVPEAGKPCNTWYRIVGDLNEAVKSPVIALHGGPGSGHDSMVALTELYEKWGIPVIFYDQIGCGRSTHLREKMGDEQFWTFDLFIREIDNIIDHLNLREKGFHLIGQSFGGMLAGAYAARQPVGLKKIVLSSSPASMPLYKESCKRRLAELSPKVREVLESTEVDHSNQEFKDAADVFMKTFVCRLDPIPEPVQRAWRNLKEDPSAYSTMQGDSEFDTVGTLKTWEGWKDAGKIQAETLLLNGRYDEVMDFVVEPWFRMIKKVKWVTLEKASHTLIWEDQSRFMKLCGDFSSGN
ncbi:Alpha/Beta hydrolase protein [Xylaria sp. FL0064]|nr:Alpha/Beta hydrolase protein [Xylaria sp. FL0064]